MNPDYRVLILYRPFTALSETQFEQTIATHETIRAVDEALQKAGFETQILLVGDDIEAVLRSHDRRTHVIFNYCDGYHDNPSGYDPITQLFEALGFAYTGADDKTLCGSQDKTLCKKQLVEQGIPTPEYRFFADDDVSEWTLFPALVKPAYLHASMGILPESVVEDAEQLRHQIRRILDEFHQPALVEDFIEGNEFRASVWGNHTLETLPIVGFYYQLNAQHRYGLKHYDSKWDETGYATDVPASRLTPVLQSRIEAVAQAAFRAVNMRDYGAIDIRVRGEQPYVIDPNQNPDISPESNFLRAIRAAGKDYPDMLAGIVRLAAARRPS